MSSLIRIAINVTGKVQGVYYRQSACKEAERLQLNGFVRNETDGSVYIEVQGEKNVLENFVEWCRKGPVMASVSQVSTEVIALKNENGFRIER